MNAEDLLTLVRYHAWANERILAAAECLSDEELRRPGTLDHGSVFDTLRHLVDADWSWMGTRREGCRAPERILARRRHADVAADGAQEAPCVRILWPPLARNLGCLESVVQPAGAVSGPGGLERVHRGATLS